MEALMLDRRFLMLAPLLSALPISAARASTINPAETFVLQKDQIKFQPQGGFPFHGSDIANLYGDIFKPGPYLVMIKWHPGWFSAPHTYATDRIQVVLSGTWHVNSGDDFDPENAVPVPAGGFVTRKARTPHYDGVLRNGTEPAVIAVFGEGPVDFALVDPAKPSWRRV